jgi:fumarylacetoacetate (FAA) hydrolase family protein
VDEVLLSTVRDALPHDYHDALLVGRVYDPEENGPSVVVVRGEWIADITDTAATLADLVELPDPVAVARTAPARKSWPLTDVLTTTLSDRSGGAVTLLAPADLQVVKAIGLSFAGGMLENVVDEVDPMRATAVRTELEAATGGTLLAVTPGSPQAAAAKEYLLREGLWSAHLEVALGPDPELFTKAPVLSAVGPGAEIGVAASSQRNSSEPEVVLAVRSDGRIVGATLGNDVTLSDIADRSDLLSPTAKDNNASAALGPFLRLFDGEFGLDDIRAAEVRVDVIGTDGLTLHATGSMSQIRRDVTDLVATVIGAHHQYPDGFLLYTGTWFSPTDDRGTPGAGFTHHRGDIVRISSPTLGTLVNIVNKAEQAPPWSFGIRSLMANLAGRGLLVPAARKGAAA